MIIVYIFIWLVLGFLGWLLGLKKKVIFIDEPEIVLFTIAYLVLGGVSLVLTLFEKTYT